MHGFKAVERPLMGARGLDLICPENYANDQTPRRADHFNNSDDLWISHYRSIQSLIEGTMYMRSMKTALTMSSEMLR